MRYKIFSNDDDTMYVKSLNPLVLASVFEAQVFSRKEIDRVMYEYGLEDDYTAIEIDEWVPGGFEIADSKDEEKMLAMKKIMFNDKYGLTQAVLEGRKTKTRRIAPYELHEFDMKEDLLKFSRYKVGDVVAIAQAYKELYPNADFTMVGDEFMTESAGWNNKMFVKASMMPHQILITDVRVERLQDISDEDCMCEEILKKSDFPYKKTSPFYFAGGKHEWDNSFHTPRQAFAALIDKISGKGTWKSNPWVFVYEFELIQ